MSDKNELKLIRVPVDISTIKKIVHVYDIHMEIISASKIDHSAFALCKTEMINNKLRYHYQVDYSTTDQPEGLKEIVTNEDLIKNINITKDRRGRLYHGLDFDSNIDYEYWWQNIILNCNYCQQSFPISNISNYADADVYQRNVCPHCKVADCVNLEFQKMSDDKIKEMINRGIININ